MVVVPRREYRRARRRPIGARGPERTTGARVLPRLFDRVAALRSQEVFVGMSPPLRSGWPISRRSSDAVALRTTSLRCAVSGAELANIAAGRPSAPEVSSIFTKRSWLSRRNLLVGRDARGKGCHGMEAVRESATRHWPLGAKGTLPDRSTETTVNTSWNEVLLKRSLTAHAV